MSSNEIEPEQPADPLRSEVSERWTLWLGPGVHHDLADNIQAGPGLQGQGRLQRQLADLADLLGPAVGPGRLVVPACEVPAEDIGILRRFLDHSAARELVLLVAPEEVLPDALLTLPRTRLLPRALTPALVAWLGSRPERLVELLRMRLEAENVPKPPSGDDRLLLTWEVLRDRLSDRPDLGPMLTRLEAELETKLPSEAGGEELIDLGTMAEELLAGISLERDRRMRFLFRPEGELSLRTHRADLEDCLQQLFDLVGRCSSPDSVIRVQVTSTSGGEADPDAPIDTTIEFPDAPLNGLPLGAELDPGAIAGQFGDDLSASVRTMLATGKRLGAVFTSLPARPGRRQVRLRLPRLNEQALV